MAAYTTEELVAFLNTAGSKGWLNPITVKAIKSNCVRVFSVLEEGEQADVRTIDVDGVLRRFANLNPAVAPDSLRDYRSRVTRAIQMFTDYRSDPVNWKPERSRIQAEPANGNPAPTRKPAPRATKKAPDSADVTTAPPTPPSSGASLVLPFPLRSELTVQLSNIPRDLKLSEANRLAAFLRALAIDYQPEEPN